VASKDDLSEQLALTAKLAAQVERMSAAMEKIEGSYSAQVDAVQKLASAFGLVDTKNATSGVEAFAQTLVNAQQKLKDAGKTTETTFQKMGKKIDETGKTISQKFPKSVGIAVAALSGLRQGFSNLLAMGKGITGFVGGFVDGLASITTSILAIPLKIFEGLVDMAAKSAGGSNELAQALEALRKQFGAFQGPTNKAIIETSKNLTGFADTGLNAFRVFGNMAERLNYIRELVTEMGNSFSLMRKEFEENGGAILAYQKGLGLAGDQMKAITQRSDMMGKKATKTLKDMTKYSYELGDAMGLDAKVISREMGEAMKDMGHFGTTSVKSLAESVTFAHKFGLELKDITGLLDKNLSFDDAAENAAQLSQAFGANIDSVEMMKKAAEGDGAGALEELRKSLKAAGVDSTKFTAVERKLIAQSTGLSDAAIQASFSLKKQNVSLGEIQKTGDKAEKKTMTQTDAMHQLADAIERLTPSGGGMKGGFWDQFFAGISAGLQSTKEFRGLMMNIQRSLMVTYQIGVKLGKELVNIIPGFKDILGGLKDFFDPKHFQKMFGGISDAVKKYFDPKSPDKDSLPKLLEGLKKSVTDFFTDNGPNGKRILEGFKKLFLMLSKVAVQGIKWLSENLAEGAKYINDLLTGKAKLNLAGASGAGKDGLGFLGEVLIPLGEALKNAWKVLKEPMKQLVHTLVEKLVELLKSPEVMGVIKPALGGIAAVLFGPAFTRAILAAIAGSITKAAAEGLGTAGKKLITGLVGKAQEVSAAGNKAAAAGATDTKGIQQVGAVNKASGEAINADKGSKWGVQEAVKLGLKLVAIATAIAIGGVEMAISIALMYKIMKSAGINKPEDIYPQLLALGAMVVGAVPLMFALKLADKAGSPSEIIKGGAMIALAVGVVGLTAGLLAGLLGLITTPSMLDAVGNMMLKMSLVFLAMVPLILAATAIGALATGPQAAVLLATAAGMAVIAAAVGAVAGTAVMIIERLNEMKIDRSFQTKIDAFLGVMRAIQAFTDSLVKVIEMMQPSLIGFLTGTEEKFTTKIASATDMIKTMVGEAGKPGGLIGMIEVVEGTIKRLGRGGPQMAAGAQVFQAVMEAVSSTLKALVPPDAFFEAGNSFLQRLVDPAYNFSSLTQEVKGYAQMMQTQLMNMLGKPGAGGGGILALVETLGTIKIPNPEAAAKVAGLISSIANITKAITPDPETLKSMQSSGVDASYAWGLLKFDNKKEGLKPEAIATTIKEKASGVVTLVNAVTSGPMKAIFDAAEKLGSDKLQGIKSITDVMKVVVDLSTALGGASKGQITRTVDKGKITTVTDMIPDLADVMMRIGRAMAPERGKGFIDYLLDAVRSMPTNDKNFMKDLETAKTLFGFVGEIPKLAESLQGVSGGASAAPNTDPLLAAFTSVTGFLEKLTKGTGETPLTKLMDATKVISFMLSGNNSPDSMVRSFGGLKKVFVAVSEVGQNFNTMTESVMKATTGITQGGIAPALKAVQDMVKTANDLNSALADGDLNKIDIKAKLQNVAKSVGLGASGKYTVESQQAKITVNLTVTMSAADIERAILQETKSIIVDRLNFATNNPTQKGSDTITPNSTPQNPLQPAGK